VWSLIIRSYSAAYPDIDEGFYVRKYARPFVNDMAGRCLGELKTLFSVLEGALFPGFGIFAHAPTEGPLTSRLEQNSPMGPIPMPVMITQGDQDDWTDLLKRFVAVHCAAGQRIDFRVYPEQDHVSVWRPVLRLCPILSIGHVIVWPVGKHQQTVRTSEREHSKRKSMECCAANEQDASLA
jgi:hypothetical protein